MTDKWIIENGEIKDTTTNMTFDSFMEIITVLNGQSKKITGLNKEKEQLIQCYNNVLNEMDSIVEENEQLKHYKEAYGTEIVKIKQTIKDMMENERTELGCSVLKQLWEAIQ